VLLCDPRLGLTELDEILLDVIRPRVEEGLKFLVLLTKSDKLNKTDAAKALQIVKLQAGGGSVKLFSALKRQGVEEVAQQLWDWAHPVEKPAKKAKAESDSAPDAPITPGSTSQPD
jgi:GTP-binding protein